MPTQNDLNKAPSMQEFHTSKTGEDKELDRVADEAAVKAGQTQKKFERDHDIFTK